MNTARKEGEQIGLEKGGRKKAIETACKLKKPGTFNDQTIAELVGLSVKEIEQLEC